MKTLVILNDPPYGTERSWNGLRLAGALARREGSEVRVFLLGDAVGCAMAGPEGARRLLPPRPHDRVGRPPRRRGGLLWHLHGRAGDR